MARASSSIPSAMITVLLLLRTGSRQQHEDCGEERDQFGFRGLRVPELFNGEANRSSLKASEGW